MIREFRLPDLGEGLTESELVAWRVAEGDTVELGQIIAEVETAKAMVELPSPHTGVVERLHAEPGTTVQVGETLLAFRVDDPEGDDAPPPNLVGYGAVAESGRRRRRQGAPAVDGGTTVLEQTSEPEPEPAPEPVAVVEHRTLAAPPVRMLAARLGVRLDELHGSGPHGLVTREDVERAAAGAQPTAEAAPSASPAIEADEERVPVRGVRKATADAMIRSAQVPQVTMFLPVDVTPTLELLDRLKEDRAFREVRVTFLAAVARALCLALRRHRAVNARWDGDSIVRRRAVHLGIAVATPRGLLVPVLRDAGELDLAGLADGLAALTSTARDGRTAPADLAGSTITITNVGVFGVEGGTPLLNAGEGAILAVGAVARRPWEHDGGIALRDVVTLSLTIDHRVLDGEQGALFLAEIGRLLADPARAFTA
ncbi:dihydrolipoamide acetyltransferase family protein [Amnibacterium sp. CER49]|uniref:dihydrolipoamide acetyltransferase family protein n=1 Tax=Amnibacterium sp. CER49 TaxID=3039161 RepID=UPI002446F7BB|nr:dihydrolipoamide acetyltransferase family protein [Amnibacterium sp. CER49]MDH2445196.1 dihydrolipoamide acetyltransferase family protein [Amnibacterium sp. CER49]